MLVNNRRVRVRQAEANPSNYLCAPKSQASYLTCLCVSFPSCHLEVMISVTSPTAAALPHSHTPLVTQGFWN